MSKGSPRANAMVSRMVVSLSGESPNRKKLLVSIPALRAIWIALRPCSTEALPPLPNFLRTSSLPDSNPKETR